MKKLAYALILFIILIAFWLLLYALAMGLIVSY